MDDLSKSMKKALRDAISSSTAVGTAQILAALRSRGLIDEFAKLTALGQTCALEQASLKVQCQELGLELRDLAVEDCTKPKVAVWKHFRQEGYMGSWREGQAIFTLLKAMCLDTLVLLDPFNSTAATDTCIFDVEMTHNIYTNKGKISTITTSDPRLIARHYACCGGLGMPWHADQMDSLISAIRTATPRRIRANFSDICRHVGVGSEQSGVDVRFLLALFNKLGTNSLIDVATLIVRDPFQFRKGWPDLTLVNRDSAMFVEVKAKDKLHRSQLITIPAMRRILPAEFFVVRVHQDEQKSKETKGGQRHRGIGAMLRSIGRFVRGGSFV